MNRLTRCLARGFKETERNPLLLVDPVSKVVYPMSALDVPIPRSLVRDGGGICVHVSVYV